MVVWFDVQRVFYIYKENINLEQKMKFVFLLLKTQQNSSNI